MIPLSSYPLLLLLGNRLEALPHLVPAIRLSSVRRPGVRRPLGQRFPVGRVDVDIGLQQRAGEKAFSGIPGAGSGMYFRCFSEQPPAAQHSRPQPCPPPPRAAVSRELAPTLRAATRSLTNSDCSCGAGADSSTTLRLSLTTAEAPTYGGGGQQRAWIRDIAASCRNREAHRSRARIAAPNPHLGEDRPW